MNLREFVTETLVEIAAGIEDAQKQLQDSGSTAEINPYMTKDGSDKWVTGGRRKNVEIVEFDVAILASEDTNAKAGIALKVASVIDLNAVSYTHLTLPTTPYV